MMTTRRVGVLLILVPAMLLAHFASWRKAEGQFLVGPVIGIDFPIGKMKADAKTGLSFGVSAGKMISDRFTLGLDADFTHFGTGQLTFPWHGTGGERAWEDHTWRLSDLGLWGTYSPASSWPVSPLVSMRCGVYLTRMEYTGYHDRIDRLAGGYSVGAGVAVRTGRHIRRTLVGSFNRFDRADEFSLLGSGYANPPLDYWSLNCGLAYLLGSK